MQNAYPTIHTSIMPTFHPDALDATTYAGLLCGWHARELWQLLQVERRPCGAGLRHPD